MRERVILEECLWARQREMLRVVSGIGKNNHLSFEERECNIITPCYISVPFRSSRRLNNNLPVLLRLTPIWRHFKVKYVILETTLQTQTVALVLPSAIGTPVLQDVGGRQPPITLDSTYWYDHSEISENITYDKLSSCVTQREWVWCAYFAPWGECVKQVQSAVEITPAIAYMYVIWTQQTICIVWRWAMSHICIMSLNICRHEYKCMQICKSERALQIPMAV